RASRDVDISQPPQEASSPSQSSCLSALTNLSARFHKRPVAALMTISNVAPSHRTHEWRHEGLMGWEIEAWSEIQTENEGAKHAWQPNC
ncbi:hypothetical protein BC936DRAFT_139203, partial [Jimgerdemannia flammicorona]